MLVVAHFAPPGSTIILEEPEIHLHPLAQSILAELFVKVSQQRKVQFIVETHSEHLFRRMQTLLARQFGRFFRPLLTDPKEARKARAAKAREPCRAAA